MMELERTQFSNRQLIIQQFGNNQSTIGESERSVILGTNTQRFKQLNTRTLRGSSQRSIEAGGRNAWKSTTQSINVNMQEKHHEGIEIQENQTQAASQLESQKEASSIAEAIEFNDHGSENTSVLIGRTSSQARTNPTKVPDSNFLMSGYQAGRPTKSNNLIKGNQHQTTPSSQLFQNKNSSVGISASIEREAYETNVLRNEQSQKSGFIENIKINSAKRPMTAKRRP